MTGDYSLHAKRRRFSARTSIAALDADRRVRQLEEHRDQEIKQLEAAVGAIR